MKLICVILSMILLLGTISGCRRAPQETTGSQPTISTPGATTQPGNTQPDSGEASDSVGILETVWDLFGDDERFASYGGSVNHAVDNAPGKLSAQDADELVSKYLIPQDKIANIVEGASLVHMMNSNIFTSAVLQLTEGTDAEAFAKAWRDVIRQNQWICGQPDELLMLEVDGFVLMAFGSADAMSLFGGKVATAFPNARSLYSEPIVG